MSRQLPSIDTFDHLFTPEAMAAVRADPRFRPAMDTMARECVDYFTGLDPVGLWMLSDIGRTSIYTAALILDASPAGLTMSSLTAATYFSVYSRGRVKDFMARALKAGELTVPMGSEPWTQRRLTIRPSFSQRLQRRLAVDVRAAAALDPSVAAGVAAIQDDAVFRRFLFWMGVLSTKDRVGMRDWTPMHLFYHREAGGRVMNYLLAAQPPERERFVVSAPVSRSALARACGVSRPHIKRMLGAAEEAKLVRFPSRSQLVIEPALSDDFERTCAFICQMNRAALTLTLGSGAAAA